jgi:hypothetical protein
MMTLLKVAWMFGFAVVALTYPVAWGMAGASTEAVLITKYDQSKIDVNKAMDAPEPKDPDFEKKVIALYGIPHEKLRVLFVPQDRFLRPEELPSVVLLPVDKSKGENPLQVRTVWFFAKWIVSAAGVVSILLLTVWWTLERQARRTSSKSEPPATAS